MYHRKQTTLKLLQHPQQINVDNVNNVRSATSKNFKNKKRQFFFLRLTLTNSKWGPNFRRVMGLELSRGSKG
jgi:hypothetical protein